MPRVDFATEIPRAAHEAAYGLGPVARGEVLGSEVVVRHAVGQHVIARQRAHVSPGRPGQRRLELGRAITHAGGAVLPGTLVARGSGFADAVRTDRRCRGHALGAPSFDPRGAADSGQSPSG